MSLTVAFLTAEKREQDKDYSNPTPAFGTAPEALLQGFALLPDVEVHVLSCVRQPVDAPEKLADNIWYHSLVVPKIGWLRTGYQGCIRAVRKKLREIRPDIVHGQGTEHNNALCAVLSGFPNVVTIHGNMRLVAHVNHARLFSYYGLTAWLEAFTIPRSAGVVCISNYTREAVAGLARKTWVVPNAVDSNFFQVQPESDPAAAPIILYVGYITPRKNQNAFIRALEPLAAECKFRLIFLGQSTPGDPYGLGFFELLRTRPWCEHHGFANREKIRAWLRASTLLALTSLEDNCPMVVLEAAAAGVPVVASNVGGVPDLVEDGKTGLLCDPLDAASMGGAVEKILAHPEFAHALAAAANRSAQARFHPAVIAQRHLEIYREVLSSSGRR